MFSIPLYLYINLSEIHSEPTESSKAKIDLNS
jgi:hypothetical protein